MPTDPLTGSRYPASSAAPNVNGDIQNAVMDLADNTIPRFASTSARDTAYANWVTGGGTMANGLVCAVTNMLYMYDTSAWRELGPRLPTIRVYRSVGTTFATGTMLNVPYDTLDATHTYNPSTAYFTPQLGNTERRVQVTKAGLYRITMEHSNSSGVLGATRIGKMSAPNVMGTVLANRNSWGCQVEWRLTAGEYVGAAAQYSTGGNEAADSGSGGRNHMIITRLSD